MAKKRIDAIQNATHAIVGARACGCVVFISVVDGHPIGRDGQHTINRLLMEGGSVRTLPMADVRKIRLVEDWCEPCKAKWNEASANRKTLFSR